MKKEVLFAKKLEEIRRLAKDQGGVVSSEQVKEAFEELELSEEQLLLVYEYLQKHKVGIGEPLNMEDYLTEEEKDYLQSYLEELLLLKERTPSQVEAIQRSAMAGEKEAQEELIKIYLPQVVDMAKLYGGQGVYLEDLIGEGNLALSMGVQMLACVETPDEIQGMLGKMIMDAMENYIAENAEEEKKDKRIAQEVNKVAEAAGELAESLGRKVTEEELAAETGMSLKKIREAMQMSGYRIEDLEEERK